jgi:DNA repair photolyase
LREQKAGWNPDRQIKLKEIFVKSVLNKKKRRDDWFLDDYTLNPYEGCSFNCQYCYIRGSKYGENMADSLSVKINAVEVLDRQLAFRVKKGQYGIIALASATDPYIRSEEKYLITQGFLNIILKHRFPVLMITKSELILRDVDILKAINSTAIHANDLAGKLPGAIISFSLSTLDEEISNTLEPGAPPPINRLRTMQKFKDAGFTVGVNLIPTLPFITDSSAELEKIIRTAKEFGADYILIGGLTLFGNGPADSKTLYRKFLERRFPHLISDYKRLYRIFYSPPKEYTADLAMRAAEICEKYRIRRTILATDKFSRSE